MPRYVPYRILGADFNGRAIDGAKHHWQRRIYHTGLVLFVRDTQAINPSKVPEGVKKVLTT